MAGSGGDGSGAADPRTQGPGFPSAEKQKGKNAAAAAESSFALFNNQPKMELFDTLASGPPAPASSKPRFEPKIKSRGPQAKGKASKTPASKPADAAPNVPLSSVKAEPLNSPEKDSPGQTAVKAEPLKEPKEDPPAQTSAAAHAEMLRNDLDLMEYKDVKMEPDCEVKVEEDEISTARQAMDLVKLDPATSPQREAPSSSGDQVVREIDVFLSRSATAEKQLYLLQYPLRPSWRPYALEEQCQQVRVKAHSKKVEIDLAVDIDSENYNQDAEEDMKINIQIEKLAQEVADQIKNPQGNLTLALCAWNFKRTTLSSTKAPPTTSYAIGVLKGNQLHLNPLHAIVQLRPSMKHLDNAQAQKKEQDQKKKQDLKKSQDSDPTADVDEEMAEADAIEENKTTDMVAVQVSVRRRETEWQEASRLHSHAYLKQLDDLEPWSVLEPHGIDSPESEGLRSKMIAGTRSQIPFQMKPDDYINKLVPGQAAAATNEVVTGEGGESAAFSRSYLDTLPLEERFHLLLSKGRVHVLQFDRLMKLAPEGCGEQEVLNVLKEKAVLVQGCWVVASGLRYPKPANIIRDYLLLLFTKNRVVQHSQLEALRMSKENLRDMLREIAVQQGATACWEFQESTDKSFIKRHQTVAKEQSQKWMELETHLREAVHHMQLDGNTGTGTGALRADWSFIKEVSSKPTTQPGPTKRPQSADKAKEVHFNLAGEGPSEPGPNSLSTHTSGHSTMSEATLSALPKALNQIFSKHNVCRLQVICEKLREEAILAAGGSKAAAEEAKAAAQAAAAPVDELNIVISRVLTNINGVYFLSTLGNPSLDPFRNVVIALLRAKGPGTGLRKTDIMKTSEIALKTEVPQATYQKVLKELCYTKGGAWVLKPGDGRPTKDCA